MYYCQRTRQWAGNKDVKRVNRFTNNNFFTRNNDNRTAFIHIPARYHTINYSTYTIIQGASIVYTPQEYLEHCFPRHQHFQPPEAYKLYRTKFHPKAQTHSSGQDRGFYPRGQDRGI